MPRWRKIFDVDNVPICLWTGPSRSFPSGTDYPGLPTAEDIYDAPNFTLFLSPADIPGELPTSEQLEDDPDQDVWKVVYLAPSYDAATKSVLKAMPIQLPRPSLGKRLPLGWMVVLDDAVRGDEIDFRGSDMTLDDDAQVVPYAMDRGYSFIKVADAIDGAESDYFLLYVVDEVLDDGRAFRQPSWQETLLSGKSAKSALFDQTDIDTINQHRAAAGRAPIDLTAGWTPAEIADMATNIRRHGREYNTGALKRRLVRWNR